MRCDAGPGGAEFLVEIPRNKGKTVATTVATFRLCSGHAANVRAADLYATVREMSHGRSDRDPEDGADSARACCLLIDQNDDSDSTLADYIERHKP